MRIRFLWYQYFVKGTPLDHLAVILVRPQSSGNLGSVARAMMNFGVERLILVDPRARITQEAFNMATKGRRILERPQLAPDLGSALRPFHRSVATTSNRARHELALQGPRRLAPQIGKLLARNKRVALVFGSEDKGLETSEIDLCHWRCQIPANPEYNVLNIAQAVAIILAEIFVSAPANTPPSPPLSTTAEIEEMMDHLRTSLLSIGFLKQSNPGRILRDLRRILTAGPLESRDVRILRGVCRQIDYVVRRGKRK